jgi:hypothetical protein
MKQLGSLKYTYLAYFSQPAADRIIYRAIDEHQAKRIVELGVAYTERAQRMIAVASRGKAEGQVVYTGIDLFEDRPAHAPGVTLKFAYKLLRQLDASVRLIPGDPYSALLRMSNGLAGTDLIVISGDQDAEALKKAWMYVPRMMHQRSLVFLEQRGRPGEPSRFVRLTRSDVLTAAVPNEPRLKMAA